MDPVDCFHLPDGTRFEVPADFENYRSRLVAAFPHQSKSLDRFFACVRQAYLLGLLGYFRGRHTPQLEQYSRLTVRDAIDRHFDDRRLKLLLTADCAHWGSPPCRTSFVFDSMLRLSYFLGNYYPRGGSQAFADELARTFEECGGVVLLKSNVRRIVVRSGSACGIEIETGPQRCRSIRHIAAGAVISNADLRLTIDRLLPGDAVDPNYRNFVHRLRPTLPCFLTHIGVRDVSPDTLREVHGYRWNGWDSDRVSTNEFTFKIFVPTLYEPRMAPPDGQVIIVQKLVDPDYESVTDWQSHKRAVEQFILAELERLIPGLRDRTVVCLSATAQTANRYTLNHHGAMLGWEMSPGQLGEHRPDVVGPVRNLFFVGQWTRPGGGITPVIVSAMRVADLITQSDSIIASPASSTPLPDLAPVLAGTPTVDQVEALV
jgi:phytoene dehydrogenase-like protein